MYLDLITEFLYQFLPANSTLLQNCDNQVTRPRARMDSMPVAVVPGVGPGYRYSCLDTDESPLGHLVDAASGNCFCPELFSFGYKVTRLEL